MKNTQSSTNRYHVPNLKRALVIMEFLADHGEGCSLSRIASILDMPKNSVFRILKTLAAFDYLDYDEETKRYSLGRKLLALGHAAVGEETLSEKSLDVLKELRDVTKETALLATLVGKQGVVLEVVPGLYPVTVLVAVGHRFPLHTAAPGKAILAFLPPEERTKMVDGLDLKKFTRHTITSKKRLRAEFVNIRERGYAIDHSEEHESINCISAPILNHRRYPIAAIWVTGPAFRLGPDRFESLGKVVSQKAASISRRFGYKILKPAGRVAARE